MNRVEQWCDDLLASNLNDRAKVVGLALAKYADWDTGGDCYPSAPTLARRVRKSVRSVERALAELEEYGWLTRTGTTRPYNTTDYQLTAGTDTGVGTSTDTGDGTKDGQYRHRWQSVPTPVAVSTDTGDGVPPQTSSRPLGSEEEDDAPALAPAGAERRVDPRPTVLAINEQIRQQWPPQFSLSFDVTGKNLELLIELLEAGWETDQILELVAEIGTPRSSPRGLFGTHLQKALDENRDPAGYTPTRETPPPAVGGPTCKHGVPLELVDRHTGAGCEHCEHIGRRVLPMPEGPVDLPERWIEWLDHVMEVFDEYLPEAEVAALIADGDEFDLPRGRQYAAIVRSVGLFEFRFIMSRRGSSVEIRTPLDFVGTFGPEWEDPGSDYRHLIHVLTDGTLADYRIALAQFAAKIAS